MWGLFLPIGWNRTEKRLNWTMGLGDIPYLGGVPLGWVIIIVDLLIKQI